MSANTARYDSRIVFLHWFMLVLIAGAYTFTELREFYPRGTIEREALKALHYSFGLSVLALIFVRIAIRLLTPTPAITPPLPLYLKVATLGMHLALYALMVGMPILGWATLSAEGDPISLFGLQLPALIAVDHELAEELEELHETIGNASYYLVGAHAAAALFHHFVRRDDTAVRILP